MLFITSVARKENASSLKSVNKFTAAIVLCIIILAPTITLYVFIGRSSWRVLLLIACCFVFSPFLGIYGMSRAATPVSPNQFLFMLFRYLKNETPEMNKPKTIEKLRFADVIKGTLFSLFLIILYPFVTWLAELFIYLVGTVLQLIMKSA